MTTNGSWQHRCRGKCGIRGLEEIAQCVLLLSRYRIKVIYLVLCEENQTYLLPVLGHEQIVFCCWIRRMLTVGEVITGMGKDCGWRNGEERVWEIGKSTVERRWSGGLNLKERREERRMRMKTGRTRAGRRYWRKKRKNNCCLSQWNLTCIVNFCHKQRYEFLKLQCRCERESLFSWFIPEALFFAVNLPAFPQSVHDVHLLLDVWMNVSSTVCSTSCRSEALREPKSWQSHSNTIRSNTTSTLWSCGLQLSFLKHTNRFYTLLMEVSSI